MPYSSSTYQWVWVFHSNINTFYTCLNYSISAWRSPSKAIAWFKGYIHICASCPYASLPHGIYLSMGKTCLFMIPLANNPVIFHNNCAYCWIRRCFANALFSESYCRLHKFLISFFHFFFLLVSSNPFSSVINSVISLNSL